jgi:adenylate kinase
MITEMVKSKLAKLNKGYMLDGYPRTIKQAEALNAILDSNGESLDCVLYMEASLPMIIRRLTGRRICRSCGAVFHMTNKPPRKEGICDSCGGELYQRSDDNEQTIRNRMNVYMKNTMPILDFYKERRKLKTINGDDETKDLFNQFMQDINEDKALDKN